MSSDFNNYNIKFIFRILYNYHTLYNKIIIFNLKNVTRKWNTKSSIEM
jgi:hypothetical protein